MARVTRGSNRGALDPIKLSQPLGATLAYLGLARAMPLLHGSQGCSAAAKSLLTRHFREPIPLQSSAVTEVAAVLGSGTNLRTAVTTVAERTGAEIIGVATTGLVEITGDDLQSLVDLPEDDDGPLVIAASTPDFEAGLSRGWASAVEAIVAAGLRSARTRTAAASGAWSERILPVLTGVSLTAADLDEIGDVVRSFGLRPLLVPDLSGSLDGHLEDGWQPLTTGGTSRDELALLAGAQAAQAVGVTAAAGADRLAEAGTEVIRHPHLAGLAAVDAFVDALRRSSGLPVPARVRRDRARFTDTLLDAHFILDGARIAVAGEPELVAAVTTLVASAGARVVAAAAPTDDPVLADLPCPEVVLGDLTDLHERAADGGAELVIGNGHTRAVADQLGAVHLPLGLPVPDRLGVALAAVTGYRGGQRFLTEVANRLLEHGEAGHRAVPGPRTGPVRRAGSTDHDTTEEMPC